MNVEESVNIVRSCLELCLRSSIERMDGELEGREIRGAIAEAKIILEKIREKMNEDDIRLTEFENSDFRG
jgi:hypothetical protein